ncbi:MAG: glycosyltransferase [Puniceicoccales bacterium]|nr:glycosyltransferase [Puniceicoccales bacterium]
MDCAPPRDATGGDGAGVPAPLFSILIPTWNNLEFLKLCVGAIRKNSRYAHQLIVHVNEGNDGTREWVRAQGLDFTESRDNIGVCRAMNVMAARARADLLAYVNDDMYVCPDWDFFLWEEIKGVGHERFYVSSTPIEPTAARVHLGTIAADFGRAPADFRERDLLENFAALSRGDWSGATAPPCVVHRAMWEAVNGYSEEFASGYASDPDFSLKLWARGVRHFKGLGRSRAYHFAKASTRKLPAGEGKRARMLLLRKWGITQEAFYTYYLRMGRDWAGLLDGGGARGWRFRLRSFYWKWRTRFLGWR